MTLQELKNKFKDMDWEWGKYSIHTTQAGKAYLLQEFEDQVWVYDIQSDSLSVIKTYNQPIKTVKEILG